MRENQIQMTRLESVLQQIDKINYGNPYRTPTKLIVVTLCSFLKLGYWEIFIVNLQSFKKCYKRV